MRTAILVTVGSVLFWAALLGASRVLLVSLDLDPWAFTFVQLLSGGVVLLCAGGRRRPDLSSFRRPATWILGVLRVLSAASYTAVLAWISVMEAGVLGAVGVPMVAAAVWLAFGRRPAQYEWLGQIVIILAVLLVVADLQGGFWHPAVLLMLFNEVCVVATTLLTERHPDNVSSRPGARLQFTGALLLINAALFLAIQTAQGGSAGNIWNWHLLCAGIFVGVAIRAPSMVLSFWSIRLVGAQNYLAALSVLPLLGMIFEQSAVAAGLIDVSRFRAITVILAVCVMTGTLLVAVARVRKSRLAAVGLALAWSHEKPKP